MKEQDLNEDGDQTKINFRKINRELHQTSQSLERETTRRLVQVKLDLELGKELHAQTRDIVEEKEQKLTEYRNHNEANLKDHKKALNDLRKLWKEAASEVLAEYGIFSGYRWRTYPKGSTTTTQYSEFCL